MSPLETAIAIVVDLLVRHEFDVIERLTRGQRLTADAIKVAIDRYGGTVVAPPAGWITAVDVVPIDEGEKAAFHAAVPVWTKEEGRSDLTLELLLTEFAPGLYETEVLDLHVL